MVYPGIGCYQYPGTCKVKLDLLQASPSSGDATPLTILLVYNVIQ